MIGGSLIISAQGRILKEAGEKGDEVVVVEIDLEECVQEKVKASLHYSP